MHCLPYFDSRLSLSRGILTLINAHIRLDWQRPMEIKRKKAKEAKQKGRESMSSTLSKSPLRTLNNRRHKLSEIWRFSTQCITHFVSLTNAQLITLSTVHSVRRVAPEDASSTCTSCLPGKVQSCTLSYHFWKVFRSTLINSVFSVFFAVIVRVNREVKVEFKLYESVFYNRYLFPPNHGILFMNFRAQICKNKIHSRRIATYRVEV